MLERLGYVSIKPRGWNTMGWFARYDGNIIGGFLLGTGMALSGACPGTVFVQSALGIKSGLYTLAGAMLAGISWSAFLRHYLSKPLPKDSKHSPNPSIAESVGIPRSVALVAFEAVCAAVIASAAVYGGATPDAKIAPVIGGLSIGAAQLVSLLLRKCLVGVSTTFVETGDWLRYILGGGDQPGCNNIMFSVGMVGGARLLSTLYPFFTQGATEEVAPAVAVLGGFIAALGARIAGGCTSGHGISGTASLSTSSMVTIGTAMAAGAAVTHFLSL